LSPPHRAVDGRRTAFALLAVAALAWGVNWSLMKRILSELPPWTYPALATMAGGSALMLFARLAGQPLAVSRGDRAPLAAIAFANFTVWPALASWGVSMLPAGRAAILNFTMPVFSIVLGYLVLGERLTRARALALGLGMTGIAILLAGDARAIAAAPFGVLLMLAAALTWAVSIVLMKRYPVNLPPIVFTA